MTKDAETLLATLERLLQAPPGDVSVALSTASDALAQALRADKIDAMLHDPTRDSLVAVGSSNQPLTALQRKLGLDVLPIANGGRSVHAYVTGEPFMTGRLDQDPEELRGFKEALGARSLMAVPFDVAGARRGVLTVTSRAPDCFTERDLRFTQAVARWVGVLAHHADMIGEIARSAVDQGRRAVAEELVTVLAHDLRNHLGPIAMRLQLLRRRAEQEAREADARELDLVQRGVGRLSALISNLLDVARLDQGVFRLDLQPLDLVALVREVARTLSTPEVPIHVRPYEEILVLGDAERLRQCVENLLSNAARHSPRGAEVAVALRRERQQRGEVARVEVVDQGPGIPHELVGRLFERFARGPGSSEGLGLGLHLARRFARAHGGDLTVDSSPGRGARFVLTVRAREEVDGL